MLSRETILEYLENAAKPVHELDIFSDLEITAETSRVFYELIAELEKNGEIFRTKKNKYALPDKMGLILGEIKTSQKGFGFVKPITGGSEIFIPANDIGNAMNGDRVYVKLTEKARGEFKAEGSVVKIVKRASNSFVGTFRTSKNFAFVTPDDGKIFRDIFITKADYGEAKDGEKVVCEILDWGGTRTMPSGKIVEVLGSIDEKGVDILSVIRKYELPEKFEEDVLEESLKIPQEVLESEVKNRSDYRDLKVITIDGVDAKDIDDAVYLEKKEDGSYILHVHIADVAHYVRRGSLINREALNRATSVYLIDRVIPMLPVSLSNGICSLNEGVDRLTMSLEMTISKDGEVVGHKLGEGVIRSRKRLNYGEVSEIIESGEIDGTSHIDADIQRMLFDMSELASLLSERREARGALNFDFPEPCIVLDDNGRAVEVEERERGVSDRIIEQFMLIANETVAEYVYWLELPFVYRVHEHPDITRLETLNTFISGLGYRLHIKNNEVQPMELKMLLDAIKDKPEAGIIGKMLLRSLRQARYSSACLGHFGLASKYYCHFTAPIRRYPDLEIHRILKENMSGELAKIPEDLLISEVNEVSEHSSVRERIAEQAEREVDDMKKCEYMEGMIGEEFEGVISFINRFGIYTELENTVEGFTKVSNLEGDYYNFDDANMQFTGDRTGYTYRIGDKVKIRVERVDVDLREIDFSITEHVMNGKVNTGKRKHKPKKAKNRRRNNLRIYK